MCTTPKFTAVPKAADIEVYQWDGLYDRWDEQPSGFAPWELARLTRASGGIYFVLPSEEFMRIRHARRPIHRFSSRSFSLNTTAARSTSRTARAMTCVVCFTALSPRPRHIFTAASFRSTPPSWCRQRLPSREGDTEAEHASQASRLESMKKIRDREPESRLASAL